MIERISLQISYAIGIREHGVPVWPLQLQEFLRKFSRIQFADIEFYYDAPNPNPESIIRWKRSPQGVIYFNAEKGIPSSDDEGECSVFHEKGGHMLNLYPMAEVNHLDFFNSDRRLTSISLRKGCEIISKKGSKRFTFEHKWMLEEDFNEIMHQWVPSDNNVDLPRKLHHFSGCLKQWAGSRFYNMPRKIENLRKDLSRLLCPNLAASNATRIAELESNIERLASQKELPWNQRARSNWLAHSDGNTKFFHSFASERKRFNHIKGLLDENGNWCSKETEIADIFLKYYAHLFTSSNPTVQNIAAASFDICPTVFVL